LEVLEGVRGAVLAGMNMREAGEVAQAVAIGLEGLGLSEIGSWKRLEGLENWRRWRELGELDPRG
jgi:hypothetical protein